MAWPPDPFDAPPPGPAADPAAGPDARRPWDRGAARLTRALGRGRRAVLRRRRPLAALLLGVAVLAGLRAVAPPPPATVAVPVAARDLPAGLTLTGDDLDTRRLPRAAVPDGVLPTPAATGQALAAPVRRGEPLTDARLTGPALLRGYPDRVAVPVRITDPAVAGLLRVGDEVEVLAVDADGGDARTVAVARVAGLPPPEDGPGASSAAPAGRLVLLAATTSGARALVTAAVRHYLTVVWSR